MVMRYVFPNSIRILNGVNCCVSQRLGNMATFLPHIAFAWLDQLRLFLKTTPRFLALCTVSIVALLNCNSVGCAVEFPLLIVKAFDFLGLR